MEGISHLYENDATIVQAGMGSGKHAMGAYAIQELIDDGVLDRVLVVTTPRVRDEVWAKEHALWDELRPPAIASGSAASRMKLVTGDSPVVVMSVDAMMHAAREVHLPDYFDGLLIDESTKVKAPAGARSKSMMKQLDHFKWRAIMTGTLGADGGLDELFGQVRWVTDRLGRTVTAFRQKYMDKVDSAFHQWVPKPGALEQVAALIKPLVFIVSNAEYEAGLPPIEPVLAEVTLPDDVRRFRNRLARHGVAEWEGVQHIAETQAARSGKVHQIDDGFIYRTGEGEDTAEVTWLHDAKLDALEHILDFELGPVVVAYQYLAELEHMRERRPGPCMGNGETANVAAWNRGEIPVLYLHPRSAAHGLNLQYGGHVLVLYSQTWSRDDHDQLIARLRRNGQLHPSVRVYHIVAPGDARIAERVVGKRAAEGGLLDLLQ